MDDTAKIQRDLMIFGMAYQTQDGKHIPLTGVITNPPQPEKTDEDAA